MSARETAGDRPRPGGLAPVVVAAAASAAVLGWLLLGAPGNLYVGYAGAPFSMAAAVLACRGLGVQATLPRAVHAFWRQLRVASGLLLLAAIVTLARSNNDTGLS